MEQNKSLKHSQVINKDKCSQKSQKATRRYKQRLYLPLNNITQSKAGKKKKNSHWNHFQQRRYIKFLQQSGNLLQLSFKEKKNKKVNLLMSKKVKTRNASQCHSHHQKMMLTYSSTEQIIKKHLYLLQNERQYFKSKRVIEHKEIKEQFSIDEMNEFNELNEQISQGYSNPQMDSPSRFIEIGSPISNDDLVENNHKQEERVKEYEQFFINKFPPSCLALIQYFDFGKCSEQEQESCIFLFRTDECLEFPLFI